MLRSSKLRVLRSLFFNLIILIIIMIFGCGGISAVEVVRIEVDL